MTLSRYEVNRQAQLHHDALIRRTAVDHREQSIGLAHVPQIGLPDPMRPARTRPVDLVVAGERLPHVGPHRLQRPHKLVERSATLLRGVVARIVTGPHDAHRQDPPGSSPVEAIRHGSAEGGHPIEDRTAEDDLTPLPGWPPGPEAISDNGRVSEERVLHPALTMVP